MVNCDCLLVSLLKVVVAEFSCNDIGAFYIWFYDASVCVFCVKESISIIDPYSIFSSNDLGTV